MSPPAPSRQVLRHLARLCRTTDTTLPKPSISHLNLNLNQTRVRVQTHNRLTQSSYRAFATTPNHQIQPSTNTPETDPQNRATPTLPDITNYYTLFPSTLPNGPPKPPPKEQSSSSPPRSPSFEIPLPTLRREFLSLQSTHHPDKYPPSTPHHKQSLALSTLINAAYKTLSDPLLRAQYLLNLHYEIDVTSEDNSAHPTDQETLMEVMEAQERIEGAETQDEINEIKGENEGRIRETVKRVGEAFERGDVEGAKGETVRLKYWRSLQDGLNDWEPGKEVRLVH